MPAATRTETTGVLLLEELGCRTMHARTVPHQNDLATEVTVHLNQEPDHVVGTDIVWQQLKVETWRTARGRESQNRDGRQSIVTIPRPLDWGLAAWSPGAAPHRLQHEAAFIKENDASLLFGPLFLCEAILRDANFRWQLHLAPVPVAPAFDRSSSDRGEFSTRDPDDNGRRVCARRHPRPVHRSTNRCDNLRPTGRAVRFSPTVSSARDSNGVCGLDAAWRFRRRVRLGPRHPSSP